MKNTEQGDNWQFGFDYEFHTAKPKLELVSRNGVYTIHSNIEWWIEFTRGKAVVTHNFIGAN